ncbi:aggregation-promoting factor C-terminal-like domain-containing protein [Cryptosporangium minutisporangium]|uniref:Transglycosylase SLT domain-containing protein n=1 Tax=Cryptosporangium minutisporangium TaxID=113569 RepID=A0ABP6T882_9ACTN
MTYRDPSGSDGSVGPVADETARLRPVAETGAADATAQLAAVTSAPPVGGPESPAFAAPTGHTAPSMSPTPEGADPAVPVRRPGRGKHVRPVTHLPLRIAAVVLLVLVVVVGVTVTVLRDTDPDTVQVENEVQADTPGRVATPGTRAEDQEDAAALARQREETLAAARNRAADKAASAQQAAAETAERAAEARETRAEEEGTSGAPVPTAPVDCGTYSGAKNTGCALLSEYGFPTSEMTCLEKLWMKESGWRFDAENPSSGAYGIPQALPGDKMSSVADDWRTNPATQIRWGLGYIKNRYDTPCGAWNYFQNNGHY